jgi:hypothetical protein
MNEQNNDNQNGQLADLEPNCAVKGGPFAGTITLGTDSTIGANAAPGATVTWTYKVTNRGSVD